MNKNVILVYGESYARYELYSDLINKKQDDNVYIFIDDLNEALEISNDKVQKSKMKSFNSLMQSHLSDTNITSDMCAVLYKYTPKLRESPEATKYLLQSWSLFLSKNIDKLSIYRRLNNKLDNNRLESDMIWKSYVTELLNKNARYNYNNKKKNWHDNSSLYYHELGFSNENMNELVEFMKSNKDADSKEYRKSDINLLTKLEQIESKGENESGSPNKFDLLSQVLTNGKLRKISKLSLEWVKEESEKPDSPISGWIFLMDYLSENKRFPKPGGNSYQPENRNRIDIDIDRFKHWKKQKTFSNGSLYSPITDSEYRHVKRKFIGETGTGQITPSALSRHKIKSDMFNVEYYPRGLFKIKK
ncbi:hypothetical protein [Xenorhabdus bharatensis]|uniref:hypothetical protein n=1 Tax=Xenorhabdus bharatensis TaxID=3136256 RepID=UPI0030F3B796